jgi:glycosyltransferase involved in cell wall biosynthesis
MEAVQGLIAESSEPVVFSLAQLTDGGRRILRDRRFDCLALVGAPPEDEIGYCLAILIALLGRPRYVALIDLRHGQVVREPLLRYVWRAAPLAIGQAAASAAALVAQSMLLPASRRTPVHTVQPTLTKLVYLRPAVGSVSAVGGSVTHSHEVIRALKAEGVRVAAYTSDSAIAETAALEPDPVCRWHLVQTPRAVKAIPASAAAGCDLRLVRAALAAAWSADAVYQRHARFSLAGALVARLSGKPLFLEYNGPESFKGRYWNSTPLRGRLAACEDAALAAATRIFVVSEVDRRSLVQRGIEPERIVVNPNGVDAERFALGGGAEIRTRHGIANDFVIGFLGTFGPWHGAPVLARAFVDVADRLPRAHLFLVGDGPELETTLEILRCAGIEARTTVPGQVRPSEVPAYLDACDLLVSPHVPLPDGVEFFGSPTKLFEYMAAGKAIIASRLGQIGDVLAHGKTGWLVRPGDVAGLAEAIVSLAEAPRVREELGAQARRQAVDRHSWKRNARGVIDAYSTMAREMPR